MAILVVRWPNNVDSVPELVVLRVVRWPNKNQPTSSVAELVMHIRDGFVVRPPNTLKYLPWQIVGVSCTQLYAALVRATVQIPDQQPIWSRAITLSTRDSRVSLGRRLPIKHLNAHVNAHAERRDERAHRAEGFEIQRSHAAALAQKPQRANVIGADYFSDELQPFAQESCIHPHALDARILPSIADRGAVRGFSLDANLGDAWQQLEQRDRDRAHEEVVDIRAVPLNSDLGAHASVLGGAGRGLYGEICEETVAESSFIGEKASDGPRALPAKARLLATRRSANDVERFRGNYRREQFFSATDRLILELPVAEARTAIRTGHALVTSRNSRALELIAKARRTLEIQFHQKPPSVGPSAAWRAPNEKCAKKAPEKLLNKSAAETECQKIRTEDER